ncbi:MAG: hypothetical protein LBB23_01645 [Rickettsiales bacterium]|jgi:hypothetical protein|nr:hypothetical protein [Rickettsiales bacterium]
MFFAGYLIFLRHRGRPDIFCEILSGGSSGFAGLARTHYGFVILIKI